MHYPLYTKTELRRISKNVASIDGHNLLPEIFDPMDCIGSVKGGYVYKLYDLIITISDNERGLFKAILPSELVTKFIKEHEAELEIVNGRGGLLSDTRAMLQKAFAAEVLNWMKQN